MAKMSLKRWASLYGVSHRSEREGFMRHTAIISRHAEALRVEGIVWPFPPTLRMALSGPVKRAQVAEAFYGDFAAYRHAQGYSERVERQAARFAPAEREREALYEVFGREATRILLLQVKEFR